MNLLLEKIMANTIDDAGCAVWQKGCCNGHPAMRCGDKTMLVRRVLWAEANGAIPRNHIIRMTCEMRLCVSLECMQCTTMQRLTKQMGALGIMSGTLRSAKIAKTKQAALGKLTNEQVRMIRSTSETGASIARRLGVPQPLVSRVRLHKSYKQYNSPWAGL